MGLLDSALGWMQDPRRTQQLQGVGRAIQSGLLNIEQSDKRFQDLFDKAFGDPKSPFKVTDKKALSELTEMTQNGLLGMAEIGMLAKATKGLPVGASIKNVGTKLRVKPPTDNVYEVMDASFEFGKLGGNKTLPIEELSGGVRMTDPKEVKRVKELADKISSPNGYVSRIIVDDLGNVLEGQHRLEALRLLGEKNVPVAVIEDLSNKYDIPAMKKALEGKFRSDETRQLLKHSIDTLEEAGSIDKALSDFAMPARYQKPFEDAIKASKVKSSYPQQEALDTAQRNAALPVEEGGLGLPKDNTPEMRAEAMGGIDAVHFSRKGGDYTELDSGKFAIAPFDAVGTHVGTPQAAMERFQNTVGYKVNNPNYALDELTGSSYPVKVLGDKPLLNQNGMPWGEDDLNTFLRKTGGHNYSDINGGKLTYQDLNADLRKKLFDEQGYTSIPYFNEVEGKGSVSYIVPPKNIRSQFAAFDPMRRNETDILAGLLPLSLLDEEKRKEITSLLE